MNASNTTPWHIIDLPYYQQPKGDTLPIEFTDIPFPVARTYMFTGNPGQVRGGHAHVHEEEVFVCLRGACTARLHDGASWREVTLNTPTQGLYVPTHVWHEFVDFSDDNLLLALSSTPFTPGPDNYIMDFDAFTRGQA